MTSASSVVSISNRSLLSVGARATISNLQEGSTESDAINILFVPTYQQLARSAHWGCLRKQAVLSLQAAAAGTPENQSGTTLPLPPQPWLYQYARPADCLQVRFLQPTYPSTTGGQIGNLPFTGAGSYVPGLTQIPYAIAYSTDSQNNPIEIILTNLSLAQCVYTVDQPNPIIWDSLFEAGMVASLAAFLVPALSLDLPLMNISIKNADMIIAQARTADGNEAVVSQNREADWMRARTVGAYGGCNAGSQWMGFDYPGMCWPGG